MKKESPDLTAAKIELEFWKMMYRGSYDQWKKWKASSAAKDQIIMLLADEIDRLTGTKRVKAKAA